MNRKLLFCAITPAITALGGCIVVGQPYPAAYPPPPFQPQCQQAQGAPGQAPTISCTRPDGSVSTTIAPAPSSAADQGYQNQAYPPPPPPGYSNGNGNGY